MYKQIKSADKKYGPVKLPLKISNKFVNFNLYYFDYAGERWIACIKGDLNNLNEISLRIESACIFGHVFNSDKCDCGYQLDKALEKIAELEKGMIIYAVDQDARGLGIETHFQIYVMRQLEHLDTKEVYKRLDKPVDARNYEPVVDILRLFNVKKVNILTNNKKRIKLLEDHGFDVISESLEAPLNENNMPTLMLEKEDLDYNFSFNTHNDWLIPIEKEAFKNNNNISVIVKDNKKILSKVSISDKHWGLAHKLKDEITDMNEISRNIAYSTEMPRLDELYIYNELNISTVVVPYKIIPDLLQDYASQVGVKIQDWKRTNIIPENSKCWRLVNILDDDIHLYKSNSNYRIYFTNKFNEKFLKKLRNEYKNYGLILYEDFGNGSWVEFNQKDYLKYIQICNESLMEK